MRMRRLPGEEGIWVLIGGDLFVFSLFFLTFLYYRGTEMAVFVASQRGLSLGFGLANTLWLLTSSLFVAIGTQRLRRGGAPATLLYLAAMGCGLGFVGDKVVEWGEKFRAGISVNTNDFYMLYFAFTGIHLLHVLLGLGVLSFLTAASRKPVSARRLMLVESGAIFWHLVDLLWIVLFALFYLVR